MKSADRLLILVVVLILLGAYLWQNNHNQYPDQNLYVEGIGKAMVKPDTLTINFALTAKGESTKLAQAEMGEKVAKFQELLAQQEIPKEKIKTESIYVSEEYEWKESGRVFLGYQANTSISVSLQGPDFEKKGGILIQSVSDIGNIQVNNSYFSTKNPDLANNEAREKAFENAKEKAEQLAKLSGRKLGKVLNVYETTQDYGYTPIMRNMAMKEMAMDSGIAEESLLSAGEDEVQRSLGVTFKLK